MKELIARRELSDERSEADDWPLYKRRGLARGKKIVRTVTVKAPARNNAELPILAILARAPEKEVKTKLVLKELRTAKWFADLKEDDLAAVYEKSQKNLFDSIVKYSKKQLVLKGQVYPIGENCEFGKWKIAELGLERVRCEGAYWNPSYTRRTAIMLESGEKVSRQQ